MSQNLKDFFKILILFLISIVFTWYSFESFGWLYYYIFTRSGSPGFGLIFGAPIAYLLFIFLTVPLFVPKLNERFYILLIFPAFWFTLNFGPGQFYFPYLFALIGWYLAKGIKKLLPQRYK